MQLTAILLTVTCLSVTAKTVSQSITYFGKDVKLESVFIAIEKQTGYFVFFEDQLIKAGKAVSVNVKDLPLKDFLEKILKDQPFTYSINKTTINIQRKVEGETNKSSVVDNLKAPPVTGIVRGPDGQPLAGVNIVVKGTKRGVVSDSDGRFTINAYHSDILVISSVGFTSKEITINGSTISVILEISTSPLDKVQVIGYGTTTKRLSTGNAVTVKAEIIQAQPVSNPLLALQGRVAGLQVIQENSTPGASITVRIRGRNSIGANNNPLYIIDGVPFSSTAIERFGLIGASSANGSPLNTISPNDIESIDILKDADATSIYGSRASNGVVLITTKKGKTGQSKMEVDFSKGLGTITVTPKFLDLSDYLDLRQTAFNNSGVTPTADNAPELFTWDQKNGTDWLNYYLGKTIHRTNASLSFSGGNSHLSYLISGTFLYQTSPQKTSSDYRRTSVHTNVRYESENHKFKLISNSFFSGDINKQFGSGALVYTNTSFAPNYPVYKSGEEYNFDGSGNNPISGLSTYFKAHTNNLNSSLNISYAPIKNLNITTNLGYNKIDNDQLSANPYRAVNPLFFTSAYSSFGNQYTTSLIAEPQIAYGITYNRSKIDFLVGSTVQRNLTIGKQFNITGYTNDELIESINYGNINSKSGNTNEYKYLSFFGRVSYNLEDKYILNMALRRDGSTRFGPDKQFGYFGSIGAAWIFSKEEPLKKLMPFLSYGKLRGSWGTTGNDGIGDYGYLSFYNNATNYGPNQTLVPTTIANSDYSWEVNKKFELALEMGFFKDRVLFNTSWYRNRSGNLLVSYPIPSTTGFIGFVTNLPALVENKGLEFDISTVNIRNRNFSWSSSFNLSVPKNKLISFPGIESTFYANTYVEGYSLGIIQRYHFNGIDKQTGDPIVQDINKDGSISPYSSYNNQGGDNIIAGNSDPKTFAGFNNSFSFKGFSLDIFLQYVKQDGINLLQYYYFSGSKNNVWESFLGYWKQAGDNTNLPKPAYSPNLQSYNYSRSDVTVSDASFLRIKNVMLSYSLSSQLLKRIRMASCKFYMQANNLYTFTKYNGYDPETQMSSVGGNDPIPPVRMITFGINLTL